MNGLLSRLVKCSAQGALIPMVFDQGCAARRQKKRATRSRTAVHCLQGAKELLGIMGVSIALNFFSFVPPPLALHLSSDCTLVWSFI